jgi:hypothetical protein
MEDYAPSTFLKSWVLVALYLCFRFHIFDNLFWMNMFFKLKGAHTYFIDAYV